MHSIWHKRCHITPRILQEDKNMAPQSKSTASPNAAKPNSYDAPIFHTVDRDSGDISRRARIITVWLGLFTCAILVSQFGRPSRAREAEFLRTSAKIDALGKVPASQPVPDKSLTARSEEAKEITPAIYISKKFGVTWQYPRTYVLRKGANGNLNLAGHPAAASAFIDAGATALATVNIPARLYAGTNFKSASLTIRVNPYVSEYSCSQLRISDADGGDGQDLPVSEDTIGAIEFTHAAVDVDDTTAAQRITKEQFFHVYENDACYEFAESVSVAPANSAAHATTIVSPNDLFDRLNEILTSVTIVPVRIPASPAVPAPSVQTPTAPPSFTQPITQSDLGELPTPPQPN
jgi:hypothetical protein